MSHELSARQIVEALARAGYFEVDDFDSGRFRRVVDDQLSIGTPRALAILAASGLTSFEYTTDPNVHHLDKTDLWRVSLTAAGSTKLSEGSRADL